MHANSLTCQVYSSVDFCAAVVIARYQTSKVDKFRHTIEYVCVNCNMWVMACPSSKTITLLVFVLTCNPYSSVLTCSWLTRDCSCSSFPLAGPQRPHYRRSLITKPCTLTPLVTVEHSAVSITFSSSKINDKGEIG